MSGHRHSLLRLGLAAASLAFAATSCGSGPTRTATATSRARAAPSSSSAPTTTSRASRGATGGVPIAWDCGGGAYRPPTLYIVCGDGTPLATGIAWQSWGGTATGTGRVEETAGGSTMSFPAKLELSRPEPEPGGLEYTRLTVTWTGRSPDGRPFDSYSLQTG